MVIGKIGMIIGTSSTLLQLVLTIAHLNKIAPALLISDLVQEMMDLAQEIMDLIQEMMILTLAILQALATQLA